MDKKISKLVVLFASLFVLGFCLNAFGGGLNNGNVNTNIAAQNILKVQLVDRSELEGEPLMIRAVVVKKSKNVYLVKIVSETYRNRLILIVSNIHAKRGEYIRGYLSKNRFSLAEVEKEGLR